MLQAAPAGPLQPEDWRLKSLLDAGYSLWEAERLASRRDVDLHRAVALAAAVKAAGKPLHLAYEILV